MTTTAHAPIRAQRPGLRAWLAMIQAEARVTVRDAAGLIVPLGLPMLILVMSASSASDVAAGDTGFSGLEVFLLPMVLSMVMGFIAILNLPSFLAYYRKSGILRRLSVTPASPAMVLVAQVAVSLTQALIGIGLALVVAVLFFDARLPAAPWTALGVGLLGLCAMYAVGMVVAAVAPSPNAGTAIALVVFLGMGALGGMFGGPGNLPEPLASSGELLPFGATVQVLGSAWIDGDVDLTHLLALVVTIVAGSFLAAALFRWD